MKKFLGLVCLLVATVAQGQATLEKYKPEIPVAPIVPRPPRIMLVNCNQGQRIQTAVDSAIAPAEILISGICTENVTIRDKDVSLRGASKLSLDGIRSAIKATPALTIRGSVINAISDLSFSNSLGIAVAVRGATPVFSNCLFENNGGAGISVTLGGFVTGDTLTFTNNAGRSISVSDSQFFCNGCDVTGNGFAMIASRGAIASLNDSVVTGRTGILATDNGTLADIDCVTIDTPHPCGMNVTGVAMQANLEASAVLLGVGDFSGQLIAADGGTVAVLGSRQIAGAVNIADIFGRIVGAALDLGGPQIQSMIRDIDATHFAQVLVTEETLVKGTIQCSSAADAFLDPTVITADAIVTGCEHASVP